MSNLWIVVPVYNEQDSVASVVEEWLPVLRTVTWDFTMCLINDGSTDNTLAELEALAQRHPEVRVVDKPNQGHGQTCLHGYRLALADGAEWVMQIDSDGQCDPAYFPTFWEKRTRYPAVYGFRFPREDGLPRFLISRLVSFATLFGFGTWVGDPGSPYRLMRQDTLVDIVKSTPQDFYLVNILVAAVQQKFYGIHWVRIRFRERFGGSPKIQGSAFARQGFKLFGQLLKAKSHFKR